MDLDTNCFGEKFAIMLEVHMGYSRGWVISR